MLKMAWAENAVIISDDGSRVTFHRKCPYCGKVIQNVKQSVGVGGGTSSVGSVTCPNCRKSYSSRFGRN